MFCIFRLYQKSLNPHKLYHVENRLYLIHFCKYILNLQDFLNFCLLSLFLVNVPQALYVNPGCLKCISGINLYPVNKNL